MISKG